jgi:hypothetical protein
MFTPTIDLKVLTNATVLKIKDTTGPDTGDGKKWDGISGIDSTNVSLATLVVTDPNGDITTIDVTSTILASDPVLGDIVYPDQLGEWVDGYYAIVYNIYMATTAITMFEDNSGNAVGTVKVTSATHLLETGMKVLIAGTTNYNGLYDVTKIDADTFYITSVFVGNDATGTSTPVYSNIFSKFAYANAYNAITRMYQTFSAMQESNEADDYLKQCNTAFGLLMALVSSLDSNTIVAVDNIYGRLMRILDYNNIELQFT